MKKTPSAVHRWILSFYLVDLFFVLSLLFSCATDPISCFESVGFATYFFYLPWSTVIMLFNKASYPESIMLAATFGLLCHAGLAILINQALKGRKTSWVQSITGVVLIDFALAGISMALLIRTGFII